MGAERVRAVTPPTRRIRGRGVAELGAKLIRRTVLAGWVSRPPVLLAGTFAILILIGTASLLLTDRLELLDALFTAASAVCVTGLSTLPGGAAELSRAGQVVVPS